MGCSPGRSVVPSMMATPSPICSMTLARRAAYSSGGKMLENTGCAASGPLSAVSSNPATTPRFRIWYLTPGCVSDYVAAKETGVQAYEAALRFWADGAPGAVLAGLRAAIDAGR